MINLKNPRKPWEELVQAQDDYLKVLYKKGKLPINFYEVALDVDNPESQMTIREVLGFLQEEIAESEDVLHKLYNYFKSNEEKHVILETLQEYNEEVADVMIFFLEVFNMLGLRDSDIRMHTEVLLNGLPNFDPTVARMPDVLNMAFAIGNQAVSIFLTADHPMWTVNSYRATDYAAEENYLTHGARVLGHDNFEYHKKDIYSVYLNLGMATNQLKNKPWKSSVTPTNMELFHNKIVTAFLEFIACLSYLGFRETQLARMILHKIEINHKRLTS